MADAACPVGGGKWLPLLQTPGIGPNGSTAGGSTAEQPTHTKPVPVPPAPSPGKPVPATPATGRATPPPLPAAPPAPVTGPSVVSSPAPRAAETSKEELVGLIAGIGILILLVAVVGAAGYGIYQWVRPPTATEVCKELDAAKTAAEAKKHVTPKLYPLIDAMFADKSALDPNDTYERTQEIDGPRRDTKLVGFRGTVFIPEAGRRVRLEAHFVVVRSDGWKVDDMVMTGVEGESLPGPVSESVQKELPGIMACVANRGGSDPRNTRSGLTSSAKIPAKTSVADSHWWTSTAGPRHRPRARLPARPRRPPDHCPVPRPSTPRRKSRGSVTRSRPRSFGFGTGSAGAGSSWSSSWSGR